MPKQRNNIVERRKDDIEQKQEKIISKIEDILKLNTSNSVKIILVSNALKIHEQSLWITTQEADEFLD